MDESVVRHLEKVDAPAGLDAEAKAMLAAAALIDAAGYHLTDGSMNNDKGGYCIWGALEEVAGDGVGLAAMFRMIEHFGGRPFDGRHCMRVCDWNNTHSTAEVVAKLRTVALGL